MDGVEINKKVDAEAERARQEETYVLTSHELHEAVFGSALETVDPFTGVNPRIEVVGSGKRFTAQFLDKRNDMLAIKSSKGDVIGINLLSAKYADLYTPGQSVTTVVYIGGEKALCTITNDNDVLQVKLDFTAARKATPSPQPEQSDDLSDGKKKTTLPPKKKTGPTPVPTPSPKKGDDGVKKEKDADSSESVHRLLDETEAIEHGGVISFEGRTGKHFYKRVRGIPDSRQEDVQVIYRNGKFSIRINHLPGVNSKAAEFTTADLERGNLDITYGKKEKIGGRIGAKWEGDVLRIHRGDTKSEAAPQRTIEAKNALGWVYPFEEDAEIKGITGRFGDDRGDHIHSGIDISMPAGTNMLSVAAGTVEEAGWLGGYGYQILIDHGNGLKTRYAHLQYVSVQKGQKIKSGQVIGFSGNTGESSGPHLHLEVIKSGEKVDPADYLDFTPWDKSGKLNGKKPKHTHKSTPSHTGEEDDRSPTPPKTKKPSTESKSSTDNQRDIDGYIEGGWTQEGVASFYLDTGNPTASGEEYDNNAFTAAHEMLPFGTKVRVTRTDDPTKSVVVRINDRGPYYGKRIIDLSVAAAEQLGLAKNGKSTKGIAPVKVEVIR